MSVYLRADWSCVVVLEGLDVSCFPAVIWDAMNRPLRLLTMQAADHFRRSLEQEMVSLRAARERFDADRRRFLDRANDKANLTDAVRLELDGEYQRLRLVRAQIEPREAVVLERQKRLDVAVQKADNLIWTEVESQAYHSRLVEQSLLPPLPEPPPVIPW